MAHRIDVVGAPGCGKTSLYRTLVQQRPTAATWMAEEEAVTAAARRLTKAGGHPLDVRRAVTLSLLALPATRRHTARTVVASRAGASFHRFARENPEFLASAAAGFAASSKDQYRRAEGYRWFLEGVRRWASLDEALAGSTVVMDESLSQKVFGILPSDELDQRTIDAYATSIPPPRGVIYLDAAAEELVTRVRHREWTHGVVIPAHRDIADDELLGRLAEARSVAERLAGALEARGVPTLRLTTSADPFANVNRTLAYLGQLESEDRRAQRPLG